MSIHLLGITRITVRIPKMKIFKKSVVSSASLHIHNAENKGTQHEKNLCINCSVRINPHSSHTPNITMHVHNKGVATGHTGCRI